jgi:hypothetical protein
MIVTSDIISMIDIISSELQHYIYGRYNGNDQLRRYKYNMIGDIFLTHLKCNDKHYLI